MFEHHSHDHYSSESGQASPFAILLSALLGVLVLAVLCTGYVLVSRGGDQAGISGTSTAIAVANATTLAQNAQVTQTVAAMETEAARPTSTATPTEEPPTSTPTPTDTPGPTETPVVQTPEVTATSSLFGTSIFASTPTPISSSGNGGTGGSGSTGTGGTDTSGTSGTSGGTLPDTGVGIGTAIAAALGLFVLLVAARRLRTE